MNEYRNRMKPPSDLNVSIDWQPHPVVELYSSMEMTRLTRDGTAEPVSRNQILTGAKADKEMSIFLALAHHVQDWQPYPVDPFSCYMYVCMCAIHIHYAIGLMTNT